MCWYDKATVFARLFVLSHNKLGCFVLLFRFGRNKLVCFAWLFMFGKIWKCFPGQFTTYNNQLGYLISGGNKLGCFDWILY